MAKLQTTGLGVALVTPFNEDLSIDFDGLDRMINHVIKGGCDYIVALGTTAETPTLSSAEKVKLTSFISQCAGGRLPLVIGIGGNNTFEVVNLIKERDLTGYSAVLSVTPYYNKPTQKGLIKHYNMIADASPLPVILYNVPGRTGVNLTAKSTLELAKHPNIGGIKEASGDLRQIEEIINNKPEDFSVISGDDGCICPIMKMGGEGVISVLANAFPKQISEMVKRCVSKEFEPAELIQEELKELTKHIFSEGNPAGIKFALSELGLINNILRLPLVEISEETEKKIKMTMPR